MPLRTHAVTRLRERADFAERDCLDEQIAEQGGLLRAGNNRQAGGVRRPPAEQLVAGTSTDDVDLTRLDPADGGEHVDRLRLLERKALEDAAHDRAGIGGLRLAGMCTELAHARGHVARLREGRLVWLDEAAESRRGLRE